jgi:hypothetical protein
VIQDREEEGSWKSPRKEMAEKKSETKEMGKNVQESFCPLIRVKLNMC